MNRCLKCGGNLFNERDEYGNLSLRCLQCGAEVKREDRPKVMIKRSVPRSNYYGRDSEIKSLFNNGMDLSALHKMTGYKYDRLREIVKG